LQNKITRKRLISIKQLIKEREREFIFLAKKVLKLISLETDEEFA